MSAPAYPPQIKTQPLARDGSLSFYWYPNTQAPDTWGYTIYDQTSTVLANVTSTVQTVTVTGLTNGQTYECWLSAGNIAGESPPAYFRPFQPGLPPTVAPTSATATKVGASNVLIEWTPSGESLVAPIQWYAIKAVSSDPAASNFRYTADGLKPETTYLATNFNPYSYTFTVQGVNCPGYSPAAVTNSVSFAPVGAGGSWRFGVQDDIFNQNQTLAATVPFNFAPGTGSYTVEYFIYIDSYDANSNIQITIGNGWSLIQGAGKGGGTRQIQLPDTSTLDYPTYLSQNTWHHIAFARDGGTGDTALWIDGSREALITNTTNYTNFNQNFFNYFQVDNTTGWFTNLNFIQGAYKYNPANTTITVPASPLTSNANTEALYLATDAGSVFTDSGPIGYTTDTTNANGLVWASNSPF